MEMALRINWPPEKIMLSVTVQLPTRVNQPSMKDINGAQRRVESMALQ